MQFIFTGQIFFYFCNLDAQISDMDGTFIYNKAVSGRNFVGRKGDISALCNLLAQGENVVISEPPRSGKTSLITQAFLNMSSSGTKSFIALTVDLTDIRHIHDFALRLGSCLLSACYSTPTDYSRACTEFLSGTHLVFDEASFRKNGKVLSSNWELDSNDLKAVMLLPYRLSRSIGKKIYTVFEEFQNVMRTEDGDMLCRLLEEAISEDRQERKNLAGWIFTGSRINAMKAIFGKGRHFFRLCETLSLSKIETRDIIDHVLRGFNATGKVIDKDLLLGVCRLMDNNICYINHFCAICDSLTRGYMMEPVLNEALSILLSIHRPRFTAIMDDLTTYQISFLLAVLEGQSRFTGADVIEHYGFNSSANVKRLREALEKKEIISFTSDAGGAESVAKVIDPLFEYWAKTYYFGIEI